MLSLLLAAVATRVRHRVGVVVVLVGAAVVAALVVPSVYARGQAAPVNTAAPTIYYPPGVGNILTPSSPGSWSNSPESFTYQWLRCPSSGGEADGTGCTATAAPDPTASGVLMEASDVGSGWRTRVTATNASGSASAVSSATPVADLSLNVTGCPSVREPGTIHVGEFSPPARLVVDQHRMTPSVITRSTQRITLRFHVIACDDQAVIGALVYATPTPFNQFTDVERPTDATGWATLTLTRLRSFPATPQQRNLIVFVRARKPGEDLLGGISSRRLVSFPVRL